MRIIMAGMMVLGMGCLGTFGAEPAVTAAPPPYVWATAYHVLPETHNNESGYFSLNEGLDGKVYVGTAKYGVNSYLVEFDPVKTSQRVVVDVHALCGLSATGFAAQAKIHTRNYVAPSGRIYVGSKQGYAQKGEDPDSYPGGYVIRYDPATGQATNLGMPMPKQGVIDVTADESRGLVYVVTCEDQHWMLGSTEQAKPYRELGPMLAPYAITLVDPNGCAHAVTRDGRIARYDPAADKVLVRDIREGDRTWTTNDLKSGPHNWVLAKDRRHAYLIRMRDPALIRIDLGSVDERVVKAENLGPLLEGKNFDSRGALDVAPDGRVYALVRRDNQTGFGGGFLHHLVRYDPAIGRAENLGVLAIRNPDFFHGLSLDAKGAVDPATGVKHPWTHGYHRLPDGTLTPMHNHMAMIVGRDGKTLYATILYPFTLLKIDLNP
ncbi:MAG: hypothetical protein A2269_03905 [Lentisphaerae bacterium RIFOXYA12_FULL_60_10]|nr:MAG: hypothetical protein A2269_03905 [Lentisphaerae bacterium RIFOXYA12_FULL_60_10]